MQHLLYQALSAEIGIVLDTDDVQLLIQKLHAAKRNANDPSLDCLVIMKSREKPESQVWIAKKEQKSGEEA